MTLHDPDAHRRLAEGSELPAESVDDSAFAQPAPEQSRRPPRSAVTTFLRQLARPVSLLAIALVGSLLWAAWLGLQVRSDNREASERRAAVAAGEAAILQLTSYDHARLPEDFAAATANLTETFRGEYTVATETIRRLITELHAKATATVLSAGLASYDDGKAEVLVFVDQTVTNDNLKTPRLDRSRMRLTLEKQDGRWLVSGVFLV